MLQMRTPSLVSAYAGTVGRTKIKQYQACVGTMLRYKASRGTMLRYIAVVVIPDVIVQVQAILIVRVIALVITLVIPRAIWGSLGCNMGQKQNANTTGTVKQLVDSVKIEK